MMCHKNKNFTLIYFSPQNAIYKMRKKNLILLMLLSLAICKGVTYSAFNTHNLVTHNLVKYNLNIPWV